MLFLTRSRSIGFLCVIGFVFGTISLLLVGWFIEKDYLVPAFLIIGLLVGWIVFKKGFLALQIPDVLSEDEKFSHFQYYGMKKWTEIVERKNQRLLKTLVGMIIAWGTLSVSVNIFVQIKEVFSSGVERIIEEMIWVSWIGLVALVIFLYAASLIALLRKPNPRNVLSNMACYMPELGKKTFHSEEALEDLPNILKGKNPKKISPEMGRRIKKYLEGKIDSSLPEDLKVLFRGKLNKLILLIGLSMFFVASAWGLNQGFISLKGIFVGLFLLPIALLIGRIEGKFFYLFAINQWYQSYNWDLIKGEPVRPVSGNWWQHFKGLLTQFKAIIAVINLPLGLILSFIGLINLIQGNIGEELMNALPTWLVTIGGYDLTLIFLTLGPLLILLIRPFDFVSVWLNQGLYEMIASPWDVDTVNENIAKYDTIFRFPHRLPGFRLGLLLAIGGIFILLGWSFCASLTTLPDKTLSDFNKGFSLNMNVMAVIVFLTLLELSRNLVEERTVWIFAREGRRHQIGLINESLYGEHLSIRGVTAAVFMREEREAVQRARVNEKANRELLMRAIYYSRGLMEDFADRQPTDWGLTYYMKALNRQIYTDEEVIRAYQQALNPNHILLPGVVATCWNNLGVFFGRLEHFREEEAAYKLAVAHDPKFYRAWSNLGSVLIRFGRFSEANAALERALSLNSDFIPALNSLTNFYIETGHLTEAYDLVKKVLALSPDDKTAQSNLERIELKREMEKER